MRIRPFVVFLALFSLFPCPITRSQRVDTLRAAKESPDVVYSKEPYVFERIETKVRYEADGTGQRDLTFRLRIQSESAVREYGLLVYPFASSFESLEVGYVRVRKPDGTVRETPATDVQEIDTPVSREAPMYTDEREKHIAVKSLAVGDILEAHLRWVIHDPIAPGHFWFHHSYFRSGICLQELLQLDFPSIVAAKVRNSDPQPTVREESGRRIYTFVASNLKRSSDSKIPDWERNFHGAPPPDVMLSSFSSWEEVGKWFADLEQPKIVVTPEIQAKAEELTKGKASEDEKLRAVYEFVSVRFRYIGVDLGHGRYTPHSASDVLANRYGDCKDKQTLFAALLKAAGIASYPVLVSSKYAIDPSFPTMGVFDHVISAIPQRGSALFLDSTAEVAAFAFLAANIRDRKALIIPFPGPAHLVSTPADPPFPSVERFRVDASIDAQGTLEGKIRLEDRGDAEMALRTVYRMTSQNRWEKLTQQMAAGIGLAGDVSDVAVARPEDTTQPFWIDFSYRRTDYPYWKEHRVVLPVPPLFFNSLNEEQKLSKEPLPLGPLQDITCDITMKFPEGFVPYVPANFVPEGNAHRKESFAEFTVTFEVKDSAIHAVFHLKTFLHEVPGGERSVYNDFSTNIQETMQRYIFVGSDAHKSATLPAPSPPKPSSDVRVDKGREAPSATSTPSGDHSETAVIDGKPHVAQALYEAARRSESNGDYAGGARILEEVVEKDPKYKLAWGYLGYTYNKLQQYEKAEAALRKAIELNPEDKFAFNNLGNALMGQKKYEEAIPQFLKQIEITPGDRFAHASLGRTYLLTKRYEKAVAELEAAASITPDDPSVYFNLGRAYKNTGQPEKAIKAFQKSVDLEPIPARWNAVAYEMALENLNLDQAEHYAELAIEQTAARLQEVSLERLSNDDARLTAALSAYWDTLGWIKFQKGDLAAAERYVASAWRLRSVGEIGDHLGQIYEKQGRKADAVRMYALALAIGSPVADTKQRLAASLGADQDIERLTNEARANFSKARTVQLKNTHDVEGIAEFWFLLTQGPRVSAVKFISGDEGLRVFSDDLKSVGAPASFPDSTEVTVLRRGRLSCSNSAGICTLVFASAETVRSGS